MKRFLCLLLVAMMIVPCSVAESFITSDYDMSDLFDVEAIKKASTEELEMSLFLIQYMEQIIQQELDSRTQKAVEPTSTSAPKQNTTSGKIKINGTNKEVFVEGFGITMQYAYIESKNGKDYLVVVYSVKNYKEESSSFGLSINIDAYQNGIELDTGYLYSLETNSSTKMRTGASIEGKSVFELKNTSSAVELELNKLWNFTNAKPTVYTIDLK